MTEEHGQDEVPPRWASQVTCPRCGATDGALCREGGDTLDGRFHIERMTAWKQGFKANPHTDTQGITDDEGTRLAFAATGRPKCPHVAKAREALNAEAPPG